MRTDSVHLSDEAIAAARSCVEQKYGKEYLSPKPRQYSTKSKSAQEAHEYGLIDEVLREEEDEEKNKKEDKTNKKNNNKK